MIAYVDSNGKFIGGCEADRPEVLHTITKVPDGCYALYIDDTQYPDVWPNMGEYSIENENIVHTPTPDSVKLQHAIDAKVAHLIEANNSANPTFVSSALGTPHTYLSDDRAMTKFGAEYAYVNSAAYGGEDILWFTLEEGGVIHTKEQFCQAYLDGRKIQADAFEKWDTAVKSAKSITLNGQTLDQAMAKLDAITL